MKTAKIPQIIAALLAAISLQPASAKAWRVNNNALLNQGVYEAFLSLKIANDNATAGDTVYLEGSTKAYDAVTLTKKLVIIGPGYDLGANPNPPYVKLEASSGDITFNTGSEGSQLIGVKVNGVIINVSDITVKRCKIAAVITLPNNTKSNIYILQNFFYSRSRSNAFGDMGTTCAANVVINNNIFLLPVFMGDNASSAPFHVAECKNNVFASTSTVTTPTVSMQCDAFENNILTNPNTKANVIPATAVKYNISASNANQFGTADSNIVIPTMTNLFVGDPAATAPADNAFKLKPGSKKGSDGTERGVFGGPVTSRYTLSGLPAIPVIYSLSSNGAVTQGEGLRIEIKARTIK